MAVATRTVAPLRHHDRAVPTSFVAVSGMGRTVSFGSASFLRRNFVVRIDRACSMHGKPRGCGAFLDAATPASAIVRGTSHREAIRKSFESQPVRTVAEACQRIFELTGIRRGQSQVRAFMKGMGPRCDPGWLSGQEPASRLEFGSLGKTKVITVRRKDPKIAHAPGLLDDLRGDPPIRSFRGGMGLIHIGNHDANLHAGQTGR